MSKERILELLQSEEIVTADYVSKELLTLIFSSEKHETTPDELRSLKDDLRSLMGAEEIPRVNYHYLDGFFANFLGKGLHIP